MNKLSAFRLPIIRDFKQSSSRFFRVKPQYHFTVAIPTFFLLSLDNKTQFEILICFSAFNRISTE